MKTERAEKEWMASVNGTELQLEEIGAGAGTVVFSPSLYTNRGLFEPAMAALSGDHRCIGYDHRGQADSGFGAPHGATAQVIAAWDLAGRSDPDAHKLGLTLGCALPSVPNAPAHSSPKLLRAPH